MPRAERHRARLRRVLIYIEAHLDGDLRVDRLGQVAGCSTHHFHRQFSAGLGVGVHRYVQWCRLKRAAYRLAFRRHEPVLEIALACGYDSPESFCRAFRKALGQSPTGFRTQPAWTAWQSLSDPLILLRKRYMTPPDLHPRQVRVVETGPIRVAALEHRGDPRRIGESVRRFIAWRQQQGLPPRVSATYNVVHVPPSAEDPEAYWMDLCAATDREIGPNELGVQPRTLAGGRCAVLRHVGSDDTLEASVLFLYQQWLPGSGERLGEAPLYFQRVSFFPDVAEHEAVTDIFLPLGRS